MSPPSDQAAQPSTGGPTFLFAFAASPLLVILAIGIDSLNPSAVGVAIALIVMLLTLAGLLGLTLWMLADCPAVSARRRRLDSKFGAAMPSVAPASTYPEGDRYPIAPLVRPLGASKFRAKL
jgi:hypothetical protein